MACVYYLTFSQRKEYGHSLAQSSTSNSLRAAVKALVQGFLQSCNQDVVWGYSHYKAQTRKICFQAHVFFLCFVFCQINFLLCCWPESLSFLCLLAGSHLLFLVTQASPTQQFASSKPVSQEENRECQQDGSHRLDNLIMEVTSYHFCCSLCLGPVYTQGKGLHKGIYNKRWNHQETQQEIPVTSVNQFNFMFNGSHLASKICFYIKMSPLNSAIEL